MNKKLYISCAIVLTLALTATGFVIGRHIFNSKNHDNLISHDGSFDVDTIGVLSTAVENLKAENKIVVYSYRGSANVIVTKHHFGNLMNGTQRLSIPATVSYHVNMAELQRSDVKFDQNAREISVTLPALKLGDVAFQPEQAIVQNTGILTMSDDTVQEFSRANYSTARRAFTKQAQQQSIANLARQNAIQVITGQFKSALSAAGINDIKVNVSFPRSVA